MPLVSGAIPNLINGVSQQPPSLRLPTQGEIQENGLSSVVRGLEKRPGTQHISEIDTSFTDSTAFIHTIQRDEEEAYVAVLSDQSIKVFDLVGKYAPYHATNPTTAQAGNEIPVYADTSFTSLPQKITELTITNGGSGYSTSGTLSATGGGGSGFAGTYTVNSGQSIASVTITNSGSGYTSTPTIVPSGNTTATITPTLSQNVSYLDVPSDSTAQATFGATTVADFTFLLNRSKTITKGTTYSHERPYEAYIYVKNGDYKSAYTVKVTNAAGTTHEVVVTTPDGVIKSTTSGSGTTTTQQLNNQAAVSTQVIAKSLATGASSLGVGSEVISDVTFDTVDINGTPTAKSLSTPSTGSNASHLNGALGSSFKTIYNAKENFIYIYSTTDNFDVKVSDGRGNEDIDVFIGHKQVPSFGKLPATLPSDAKKGWSGSAFTTTGTGFTIKVGGDNQKAQDDYYVYWNGDTWKETLLPRYAGETTDAYKTSFDASTMPHQLKKQFDGNKVYFVLEQSPWVARTVGDIDTNPFPSFTDFEINDIFFHRNRLGFLSDENVIFSEAGGFYNLFVTTTLTILDSEPIDVAVSNNQVSILRHAIPFNESLLIFSDLQQFKVTAGELLTPTTVSIDVATNFETDTTAKPVPAGRYVYFPFKRGDYSGVREYFLDISTETSDAQEVTAHVPEYIEGNILQLASSSNEEILLALGDTDRKTIYVYKYFWSGAEKLQSSWSKWTFDADVLSMSILGSDVFLLFKRSNSLFLEKLTLSSDPASAVMDDNQSIHLDRRVELKTGGTTSLPYTDADDDDIVYIVDTGKITSSDDFSDYLNAIKSITITNGGSGYSAGTLSATGGGGSGFAGTYTVDSSGKINSVTITNIGSGYTSTPTITISDTSGSSAVLTPTVGFSVFAGIPFTFKYRVSEQVHKENDVTVEIARLQIRNMSFNFSKSGFFEVIVSPLPTAGRTSRTNTFSGLTIGTAVIDEQSLQSGTFRVPVLSKSDNVTIEIQNAKHLPCRFQSAEYEGFLVVRSPRS